MNMKRILFGVLFLSLMSARAPAQIEMPWHTMDGGGGISTGGVYEIRGTIGQPDAGISTGGVYQVTGGFWGWAVIVQTEGLPTLHIRYLSASEALVYWKADTDPAIVQRATSLALEDWEDDPGTPVWEDGEYRLLITPTASMRFYKLRRNE